MAPASLEEPSEQDEHDAGRVYGNGDAPQDLESAAVALARRRNVV